jgi:hypothetical protein
VNSGGDYGKIQAYDWNAAATKPLSLQPIGGNVGIGAATPVGLLSVNTGSASGGTSNWDSTYFIVGPGSNTSGGAALGLGYNTSSDYAEIRSIKPGTSWEDLYIRGKSLHFFYQNSGGSSAEGLTLLNGSGSVGIGTQAAPYSLATRLAISASGLGTNAGDVSDAINLWIGDGNATQLRMYQKRVTAGTDHNSSEFRLQRRVDITDSSYLGLASSYLALGTNNVERMRIDSTGNVGIGTTTPSTLLSVANSAGTASVAISGNAGSNSQVTFGTGIVPIGFIQYNNSTQGFNFGTGGSSRMRLDSSGNLGIGVTNPTSKLQVAGDITPDQTNSYTLGSSSKVWSCIYYDGGSLGSLCVSDARLKENIHDLTFDNALEKVAALQPRTFSYIADDTHQPTNGLIAQEVLPIAPELVSTGPNGYYGVNYGKMQWLVFEALQELNVNVESLAASTTPAANSFAERFFNNLLAWFANAGNGIGTFFAKHVYTEELCVTDAEGQTCLTRAELKELMAGAAVHGGNNGGSNDTNTPPPAPVEDGSATTTDNGTSTPPTNEESGGTETPPADTGGDPGMTNASGTGESGDAPAETGEQAPAADTSSTDTNTGGGDSGGGA